MRIAILSDVHGNVRALEAVLADMRRRGPFDQIINGGDLAFGGPRPREAMDLLMREQYPTVRGNTDEWVAGAPGEPEFVSKAVVTWTREHLTSGHLAFLRNLPLSHRVEPPGGPPLVVVHATPVSTTEVLAPDAPVDVVARAFEQARTRTLAYGHIHRPYVRDAAGGLVVNVGSVGFPFDGVPRSAWAVFTLEGGRWSAEIVRVAYDQEAVAQDLLTSEHPDAAVFARRARTGQP
ncbi:MAG TPA: metallophosphoesterase family protein [bacterium]|nr:metallophosphoesterase family protein [bacterium]